MARYEYIRLPMDVILQDIIDEYQLMNNVKNGFIVCEIWQGMWQLSQTEMVANKIIAERLTKHGQRPCEIRPSLWKHGMNPVIFFLWADAFGVKYVGK